MGDGDAGFWINMWNQQSGYQAGSDRGTEEQKKWCVEI